jgi:hypothetical protein
MIVKGSKVDLIKPCSVSNIEVSKKKPMRGEVIQVKVKKIAGNRVRMCLFCPEWQTDKTYGYEFSDKWLDK